MAEGTSEAADRAFEALSRRRFLRWGATAVVFGGAVFGGLRWVAGSVPHVQGLRVLDDRRYATLHALVRTLFPVGPVVKDARALADRVAREGDTRLTAMPPALAEQLLLALVYVEAAPVLFDGQLRTFSRLDDAARAAHWARHWERTDDDLRRGAGTGLRRMLTLWVYDTPELWPAMHYPGPVLAALPVE